MCAFPASIEHSQNNYNDNNNKMIRQRATLRHTGKHKKYLHAYIHKSNLFKYTLIHLRLFNTHSYIIPLKKMTSFYSLNERIYF